MANAGRMRARAKLATQGSPVETITGPIIRSAGDIAREEAVRHRQYIELSRPDRAAGEFTGANPIQVGATTSTSHRVTITSSTSVTVAVGTSWLSSASGTLQRIVTTATQLLSAIPVATTTNRLDIIVMDQNGTASRIAGTDNANTTLDARGGAAAIPSGSMLLADILVTTSGVIGTNIRDRRPHSAGAHIEVLYTGGDQIVSQLTTPAAVPTISAAIQRRVECTGLPLDLRLRVRTNSGTAAGNWMMVIPAMDGVALTTALGTSSELTSYNEAAAVTTEQHTWWWRYTPTVGSHLFTIWAASQGTVGTMYAAAAHPLQFIITEEFRPAWDNGTT